MDKLFLMRLSDKPGGYPVARLALVWKHEAAHRVKEFINA